MSKPGKGTTFSMTLVWCVCYFLVVIGLGAFGREVLDSPIWYVALVAIVSFAAAYYFSQYTEYFHKDAVDFFYYTVGVVGIVLTFWGQTPERAEVTERIAVRALEEQSDRAAQTLDAFEAAVPRWEMIVVGINADPAAYVEAEKQRRANEMVTFTDVEAQACARAFFGPNAFKLPDIPPDPTRPQAVAPSTLPSPGDVAAEALAKAACDEATKRVEDERARILAMPLTLDDIKASAASSLTLDDIRNGAPVAVENGVLLIGSASDAQTALALVGDPAKLTALRTSLEGTRDTARSTYEGRRGSLDQLLSQYRFQELTLAGLLRFHFWPYVLILLLSLKLSRPRTQ